ncbi:hypothetical protein FMM68_11080 [Lachnospiraceae bacterium MD329]|nr:hypothetical protein [Lachnospiraceae bacterium MD329]
MYLKSMLKFCKKARVIRIEYHGNQKFLTDGEMRIYLYGAAAKWNSNDFAIMLELDDDTIEKFTIEDNTADKHNAFEVAEMQSVEKLICSLNICGIPYQPFMLPDDTIFLVDMTRLSVFKDFHAKQYFYKSGSLVIAKDNLVIGTIYPTSVNLDTMKNFTSQLHKGITNSAAAGFFDAGGQMMITDM